MTVLLVLRLLSWHWDRLHRAAITTLSLNGIHHSCSQRTALHRRPMLVTEHLHHWKMLNVCTFSNITIGGRWSCFTQSPLQTLLPQRLQRLRLMIFEKTFDRTRDKMHHSNILWQDVAARADNTHNAKKRDVKHIRHLKSKTNFKQQQQKAARPFK